MKSPFTELLKSHSMPRVLLFVGMACSVTLGKHGFCGARNGVEWPAEAESLVTNRLPVTVDGVRQDFLGATFHLEQFDPATTTLSGHIETTNTSAYHQTVRLCITADAIAYHIRMRDMRDKAVLDPQGTLRNWVAREVRFLPHETKSHSFKVRLKDHFDLRAGTYQLLFVFDERLIRRVAGDRFTIRPWSRKKVLLRCE